MIAPADTGYGQTIVLNGETLDLTGIPSVSEELPPAPTGRGPTRSRLLG